MGQITKLVIYTSAAELEKHAAAYPNLVNYNPFTKTGEVDDGAGHYAHITFVAVDPASAAPSLPTDKFDNVEFVGFPMPKNFVPLK